MTIPVYPLHWPKGWPREQEPQDSKFETTLARADKGVRDELWRLGADDVVISSNAMRNRDGTISSRQGHIEDTGVAVYFTINGEPRVIPCDRWTQLRDNLRAIEKMIEALRGIERWGAKQIVDATFVGFAALPETTGRHWYVVLGIGPDAYLSQIETAYRQRLKQVHPDGGGSTEAFHELQEAYRQAKEARS